MSNAARIGDWGNQTNQTLPGFWKRLFLQVSVLKNINIKFNQKFNSAKSDHNSILHVCLYSLRVPQRQSNVFCFHHTPYPPELFMWNSTQAWEILKKFKRSIRQLRTWVVAPLCTRFNWGQFDQKLSPYHFSYSRKGPFQELQRDLNFVLIMLFDILK